jgi:iron complex outermembrane receptor protein
LKNDGHKLIKGMSMNKRLWVLNPLLLATALPAWAADDSMIVSANRTHRTVAEMAQTTWVIEGQEIEQQVQGGKEFKDVLAQLIPGIDVSSQGRTNYGMNMRGRAIVVLIDGVRLNSSRTDSRQLDSIDPFNIEHIEVISGATSLYGGGSTGGLINIVTKKGQQERQVDLELGAKPVLPTATIMMNAWRQRSAAVPTTLPAVYRSLISVLAAGMTAITMR